ncbi:hypothetical protein GCM10023321_81110 [Pseudonocardia eucalypti]|uniref:Uncharacterized protein n=1 Tax=Pseudonocardia eucalypti TaxID=648755 RepID=A0ABP9RDC6_9PSEU
MNLACAGRTPGPSTRTWWPGALPNHTLRGVTRIHAARALAISRNRFRTWTTPNATVPPTAPSPTAPMMPQLTQVPSVVPPSVAWSAGVPACPTGLPATTNASTNPATMKIGRTSRAVARRATPTQRCPEGGGPRRMMCHARTPVASAAAVIRVDSTGCAAVQSASRPSMPADPPASGTTELSVWPPVRPGPPEESFGAWVSLRRRTTTPTGLRQSCSRGSAVMIRCRRYLAFWISRTSARSTNLIAVCPRATM